MAPSRRLEEFGAESIAQLSWLWASAPRTTATISVPPGVSLTREHSGRRVSASPTASAPLGLHRIRTTHEVFPMLCGAVRSPTRMTFLERGSV